jgi:hypothetical protein
VLYVLIFGTAIVMIGTALLAQAVLWRAIRRLGITPMRRAPWLRTVLGGIGISAALSLGAMARLPVSWVAALAAFALFLHGFRLVRALTVARRFYANIDDACRDPSDARIVTLLGLRSPPSGSRDYTDWVSYILLAARRAHDLGQSERAIGWSAAIDPRRVQYDHGLSLVLLRASFALSLGRREDARAALAYLPTDLNYPAAEESVAMLRALLAVLDGDVSDARFRYVTEARARATEPSAADGWAAVDAHLRAARGDVEGATEILRTLVTNGRRSAVERIGRHVGPASPLVARVLEASPYR